MRTKTGMKARGTFFISLILLAGLVAAGPSLAETCGDTVTTRLIAGQHLDAGVVTITNDETDITVTYVTDGTWEITETHLDVATSPEQLKQTKKGNAIPGAFRYCADHDPGVYEATHTIDITAWPAGTQLYFAAHAVVTSSGSSETAWGEGIEFPGKNWAMYFGYEVQACEDPPLNPGIIEFQDLNISELEHVASIMVTLTRTMGSDGRVSVEILSNDISATADDDYAALSTTIVFEDGETMKQVEVFILNDELDEADEQFQLKLSNVLGAEIGPQDTATITIIDDDEPSLSTVIFSQPEYTVMEYEGSVAIEVNLDQANSGIVSVDYTLTSITAEADLDYIFTSGRLEFAVGQVSKTIVVQIVNDFMTELSPETFTVNLSNPVGATLIGQEYVNVLIIDDDDMPE